MEYFAPRIFFTRLPWWLCNKQSVCNARVAQDTGLIWSLGQEDPLEEGMATHSCLENPKNRRAWQATVHRVAKSRTQLKQLSMHAYSWPDAGNAKIEDQTLPSENSILIKQASKWAIIIHCDKNSNIYVLSWVISTLTVNWNKNEIWYISKYEF